ncbi:hypothetical protein AAG906_010429 [Vitis piasezkii]
MNFMSYVAEVSRGWDEPNARDMGRMTSQPNAKGEMYILNDDIDMKAKIYGKEIGRARNEEDLCLVPFVYLRSTWWKNVLPFQRNHPNCSWKPQPPQYQQPAQAPQQASNLDQAMVNLSKVVGDFLGAQKSINAQLSQMIDSVDSSLNKMMDGIQNDLSHKIDNLQYSISRFANLNKVQEKENFPSQHYQNSKGIHEVEAQKGESSMVKEVKTVITLRSGKEVDLPTSKLEHKVESEAEKEKREEIKGKKKGKSTEKDGYDVNVHEEPQRIVIKEEMMKHMPPPFTQALYGKIIQTKSQESIASNGAQFGVETKKLWLFEDDRAKLNGNPREVAKMPIEPRDHASKEESPLTEITHMKSLIPFLTSLKPSKPIAPETTRTEAKVLIQPTQEATTNASAPQDSTIT